MLKIRRKEDSILMRMLSYILFFNKGFMTKYATTIGSTIYLPKGTNNWDSEQLKSLIAHEYLHILDSKKDKLYPIKYLFPQILSLLILLIIPFSWYGLLFLIFLLPWPAYWRMRYEVRGYGMSIAAYYILYNGTEDDPWFSELVDRYNKKFKNSQYYWMWPFGVNKKLRKILTSVKNGDIWRDEEYSVVKKIILD